MINRIKEIKKQLGDDLLILAHHYQRDEIVNLADAIGDSLKLAQIAEENKKAKYIVFCGVHFMAETADILSEDYQVVLQPALNAGCPMADMADRKSAEKAWEIITGELGNSIVPITYINSKAEVKAFCGIHGGTTVTSGNADKVVKWGFEVKDKILFLPDQNLGKNTAVKLGIDEKYMALYDQHMQKLIYDCKPEEVKMILWNGYCHVHHKITSDEVLKARSKCPDANIIVHPECKHEVVKEVDGSGSTTYLIKEILKAGRGSKWIIGTEANLVRRLKEKYTNVNIDILNESCVCDDMNMTTVENLCETLEDILRGDLKKQITVDKQTAKEACMALDTMLSLS